MASGKYLALVILGLSAVTFVSGEVDVNAEINRVEEYMRMKPSPEIITNILQQLQTQCKTNRTIEQSVLNNASRCVESHLNETQLIADIKQAVPEGNLDTVFRDMCVKWPKIKSCLIEFFVIIDQCWEKGEKVNRAVDESVRFFCGDDNDGARIALFIAEGGMQCLEQHGDSVKTCIESKHEIPEEIPQDLSTVNLKLPNKNQVCDALNDLKECTTKGLKKCKDPTPENLATSMIRAVGRAVDCKVTGDLVQTGKATSDASSDAKSLMSWAIVSIAGAMLL